VVSAWAGAPGGRATMAPGARQPQEGFGADHSRGWLHAVTWLGVLGADFVRQRRRIAVNGAGLREKLLAKTELIKSSR
jgi:hypothetical protein